MVAGPCRRRRGGFHIRPRSPAPPQTGPIWNRPLQGLRCGRARGWPRAPPLFVGVGFIPPVEPCVNAGLRLATGFARHRRAGVHARRTAAIQNRDVRAAASPAANRGRAKMNFPNTKKRPRHVAGPWFDTQEIHARKGCGRDGAGPPGGLRARPDSGQLRTFTKWRPPPHRKAGLGQAGPQYTAVPSGGPRGGRS